MPQEFRRTLTDSDFTLNTETAHGVTAVVLVASVWTKVGTYTVPKGVKIAVGQRFDAHFYASFEDSNDAVLNAKVRIVVSNPTEYNRRVVGEFSTREVTAQTADKKLMPYAPLVPIWVKGDSKIIIEAMPLTTVVEIDCTDKTSCEIRIPVTRKKG